MKYHSKPILVRTKEKTSWQNFANVKKILYGFSVNFWQCVGDSDLHMYPADLIPHDIVI